GATKASTCGPPAKAWRPRLRQKRKAPPAPSARAASSHGMRGNLCSGAISSDAGSGAKAGAAVAAADVSGALLAVSVALGRLGVIGAEDADCCRGAGRGCAVAGCPEAVWVGRGSAGAVLAGVEVAVRG